MKNSLISLLLFSLLSSPQAALASQGKIIGEEHFSIPAWFKESFLEIKEDNLEAIKNNKHLMLFMHIDRCPYCTRMLDENFRKGSAKDFIKNNFDVIALNIRGDREVNWNDNTVYSEKQLAKKLNVHFTPTIVILNNKGKKVYQMNGYRQPQAFAHILNYIHEKQYLKQKLSDYIRQKKKNIYTFKSHPYFKKIINFSSSSTPFAVIFEDNNCSGCDEFHKEVLNHQSVLKELKKFTVVRLDINSEQEVIDNTGTRTSIRNWAKKLELDYRPGTILFDKGREITRADGRLYHFHYKELLRYVSGKYYLKFPTYLQYLGPRQKSLLKQGINIDVRR